MYCSKCGSRISREQQFCESCGSVIQDSNLEVNSDLQKDVVFQESGGSSLKKNLLIIGGVIIGVIVFAVAIIIIMSFSSNKLVCESGEGDITIMYNNKTITGYKAVDLIYQFDEQKLYAEKIGIDKYIDEFSEWFSNNIDGSCKHKKF